MPPGLSHHSLSANYNSEQIAQNARRQLLIFVATKHFQKLIMHETVGDDNLPAIRLKDTAAVI